MTDNKKDTGALFLHYTSLLIFFIGSFVFFGFFCDYVGFFQEKLSLFIFSKDSFLDNIKQPGSFLKYSGTFLTAFFYYRLSAALIMSLIICLIVYFLSKIIGYLSGRKSIFVPLVIGTIFLILQTNYQYLLYNNLGILLQLILFYLTIRYLKGFIPIIVFPLWYWITGGFSWIFGLMYVFCLLRKSVKGEMIKVIALFILSFLMIWLLEKFLIFQTFKTLVTFPFSNDDTGSQLRILLPVIVILVFIPFFPVVNIRKPLRFSQSRLIEFYFLPAFSLLLIASLTVLLNDRVIKEYFKAEKLFYKKDYLALTKFITEHPTNNRLTIFLNNIALCETGKLNDMLFHFTQSPDGQTLFLKWEMYGEVLKRGGYFYYTTGMINEAQRWAYENMVMKGLSPEGLKMLIKTEIINGNYKVAAKYVSLLKKTLFYRTDARKFEKLLFNEDAIGSDPELGIKRKEKIRHDFFSITDDPYVNIERVLTADSLNRKAFEYKLAFLMLTEDYNGISANMPKLETMGFTRIPVHLEEAWLVCRMSGTGLKTGPGRLSVNPQTEARFRDFLKTFEIFGKDLRKAQPALKKKFGNTFWYYAFYH